MDKRGISPLIATVLIIGFTVALAAVIITWGGRFILRLQAYSHHCKPHRNLLSLFF